MLKLVDIKKDYVVAGGLVQALKGINLNFRRSEFVSILGPSGCGKTTLLNIIGGLDKYTSGDLVIEGKTTKSYNDGNWDTYRNHSVGFIFQSYHLIPHQTILQNVELALMIAGVSKQERRERAIAALDKVGLKDKLHNKPNQLSGGQAQRVAIARALINDPEIVLADEPTGALDSATSLQIMELLKEISRDKLVIMVTHNPELAEKYSTRIVRLLDGEMTHDSMPYSTEEEEAERLDRQSAEDGTNTEAEIEEKPVIKTNKGRKKQSAMSVGMAMGLSCKNLLSKRRRTAMVSVAGSIGIIGVSMVLAISAGVQGYITGMENDMLSGYPVSVTRSTYDFTSLMELSANSGVKVDLKELAESKKVYVNSLLETLGTFSTGFEKTNNIDDNYVAYIEDMPEEYVNLIQYDYAFNISNNLYTDFKVSENLAGHINSATSGSADNYKNEYDMSVTAIRAMYASVLTHVPEYSTWGSMISTVETFSELPDNFDYVMSQYDVVAVDKDGNAVTEGYSEEELKTLFSSKDTLVMVLDNYKVDDLTLAQFGYFTEDEFLDYAYSGIDNGKDEDDKNEPPAKLVGEDGFPYSFFIGNTAKKFTYYPNDCVYNKVTYRAKPNMTDEQIRMMIRIMPGDVSQTAQLAERIIAMRKLDQQNGTDVNLKGTLRMMILAGSPEATPEQVEAQVMQYYELFKLPPLDSVTEGYVANAYSDAYTTTDADDNKIELPAFKDKSGYDKRVDMGVKIILQKKESVSYGCLIPGFYYTNALTKYILDTEKDSEVVNYIGEKGDLKELPMYIDYYHVALEGDKEFVEGENYYIFTSGKESKIETGNNVMSDMIGSITGTAGAAGISAAQLGGDDTPIAIYIYPVDFEYKELITDYLDAWNNACLRGGTVTLSDGSTITGLEEKNKITYADTVGMIIAMVNTMIQMITIALIAFTALSLVVSTVMIGIITYVSVVERVKEIGILRAVGARKKDIKRLFNAETFIIGLIAGIFGIAVTYLLSLFINILVQSLAGFWGIAALPWWQALIMIILSVALTLVSGLIPASAAAKKDPVVALRTE